MSATAQDSPPSPGRASDLARRLDHVPERRLAMSFFVMVFAVFLVTARHSPPYHVDAMANVWTAWSLATTGSPYLDLLDDETGPEQFGVVSQLIRGVDDRPISKYPPGTALMAAPAYLFARDAPWQGVPMLDGALRYLPTPSLWPAAIVASATAAGGLSFLVRIMRRRESAVAALTVGAVAAFGTSQWSLVSNVLWQHGPTTLWILTALWFLSTDRQWLAGWAMGAAVLVRPQTAVIAAVLGIWTAIRSRSLRPLFAIGAPSMCGAAAYAVYNLVFFHQLIPDLAAGYFVENLGTSTGYLTKIVRTLFDSNRGLLVFSPFLVFSLVGVWWVWRKAPAWAQAGALAGAAYLLFQLQGNIWQGGDGFFGYRYPTEAIVAAGPLLAIATLRFARSSRVRRLAVLLASGASIVMHGAGAIAG